MSLRYSGRQWYRTNRIVSLKGNVLVGIPELLESRRKLTALASCALCVSILRSAVTSKSAGDQGEDGKGSEAHYDYN